MHFHYNSLCPHTGLITERLIFLYASASYEDALREIKWLDGRNLKGLERAVVNMHEVVVRLAMRQVGYDVAKQRLDALLPYIEGIRNHELTAAFLARYLVIATRYGDHTFAAYLTNHFFDKVPRNSITEAHWRSAQGTAAHHMKGPREAIRFYVMALSLLRTARRPCLQEIVARRLALCLNALGDKQGAVDALRDIGLPVSIEPLEDHILLSELLVLPVM